MNDFPPDMNRDDLDKQIRAALQVEASPQQLARLETIWHRRSRAQRQRRRIAVASALAAGILVAVTASLSFFEPNSPREPIAIDAPLSPVAPPVPETQVAESPGPESSPEEKRPRTAARAPTTYERFVFVAKSHKAAMRPSAAVTVTKLIERLSLDPGADVEQLAEAYDLDPPAVERQLVRRLARAKHEEIQAVLQLLGIYGGPRSTPQVLQLAQRIEFRNEALTTLERIVGLAGLPAMAAQSPDPRVRAAIFRRLLTGNEEDSLSVYLALIQGSVLSHEALAVADKLSEPLLARLFHRLDDEDEEVRLAAALVLGHTNGPVVTEELIRRATDTEKPRGSREAWIALFACRDERATRFLAYAGRQPRLLGSFNRAYMWWQART